ncbi:hypothetical protein ACVFVO_12675 [Advenella kashmirensis]
MPLDGILSVREFITTPVDGTTSNQAGIINAINAARTAGARLFWPVGTYVSDANLPNFHNVRHIGPGVVKRGTSVFYVEPVEGQANIIYVRPSGASLNADGLNTVNAISINRASEILLNYGPVLGGTWNFKLSAGTYIDGTTNRLLIGPRPEDKSKDTLLCADYVVFEGPDVGYDPITNSRPAPTAVFDGRGASAIAFNFRGGFRAIVRNLKFQKYNGTTSSGGVAMAEGGLRCENVHTSECSYGITGFLSLLEVKGGWIYGSADKKYTGIRSLFLNKHDIGNQGAGGVGQGPLISFCNVGFLAQEGSTGHSDFVTYEDNIFGINATVNARVNANGSEFKRNTVGVVSRLGAVIFAPYSETIPAPVGNVKWNTGTADANNDNMRLQTGEVLIGSSGEAYAQTYELVFLKTDTVSITGTTTESTLQTYPIVANRLTCAPGSTYKGKILRVKASGQIEGVNGTKAFRLRLGPTQSIVSGGTVEQTGSGAFTLEASIYLTGPNSQKACMQLITAYGTLSARASTTKSAVVTGSPDTLELKLSCELSSPADSVTIETFEVELTG